MSTTARKRSTLGPQSVTVQSSRGNPLRQSLGGVTVSRSNVVRSSIAPPTYPKGSVANKTRNAVSNVLSEKNKEKQEMNQLNVKLAETLQNTGYLKSQVIILNEQVEKLKKEKCPEIGSLRDEYEEELQSYKDALAECKKQAAEFEPKLVRAKEESESKDDEIAMLRRQNKELEDKLKMITNTIGDLEGEIRSMRLNLDNAQTLNEQKQAEIDRLRGELENARNDLDHARQEQLNYAAMYDEMKADAEFDADVAEKQIKLLQEEVDILKRCQPDLKQQWDQSFKTVMKQVQETYDQNLQDRCALLERQYADRIRQMELAQPKTQPDSSITVKENRDLKSKMNNTQKDVDTLKRELEDLRQKYQDLLNRYDEDADRHDQEVEELKNKIRDQQEDLDENAKEIDELEREHSNLQLEIEMYRKLLDGEEASLRRALQGTGKLQSESESQLSSIIGGGSSGGSASQSSTMQTSSGRVNLQRKCRGPLQFSEVRTDGVFCELENTGNSSIDLTGYVIKRENAKGKEVSFPMPNKQTIAPNSKLRVYANAFEDEASDSKEKYLVAEKNQVNNWGVGNGTFICLDGKKSERASAKLTFT